MIVRTIKAEVFVICRSQRLRKNIKQGLDNSHHREITSSNNCIIKHWYHYLNSTVYKGAGLK